MNLQLTAWKRLLRHGLLTLLQSANIQELLEFEGCEAVPEGLGSRPDRATGLEADGRVLNVSDPGMTLHYPEKAAKNPLGLLFDVASLDIQHQTDGLGGKVGGYRGINLLQPGVDFRFEQERLVGIAAVSKGGEKGCSLVVDVECRGADSCLLVTGDRALLDGLTGFVVDCGRNVGEEINPPAKSTLT